jgi:hypothetical protein
MIPRHLQWIITAITPFLVLQTNAYSHEVDARGSQTLGWQSEDVSRVVSFTPYGAAGEVVTIEGKQCLHGFQFYFDVLDNLAFDVDETVELAIEFDLETSTEKIRIDYDKNGGASTPVLLELPKQIDDRFHVKRIRFERARFAGREDFSTDFRISAYKEGNDNPRRDRPKTTICNVSVERSFSTVRSDKFGWINLAIRNELGDTTPARVALYDESGRMPLPANSALEIEDFSNRVRTMLLPVGTVNWPSENRYAFYIDGEYRTRLPTGDYSLVVTKGIEYRFATKRFRIEDDSTLDLAIDLERWINMPSQGWVSGDIHVHIPRRDSADNRALWLQAHAEDLHVASSLKMGNIAETRFPQSYWGNDGKYGSNQRFVVAGQEDPRSAVRGHTIHLNLTEPARNPDRYLLYHEVFEKVAERGGISGYAHLKRLGAPVGMALDVPYGLVKFIEVLQRGRLGTNVWFDFLNLGYKIAPAAGSDVPYGARIGDVRSYVNTKDAAIPESWFAGLSDAHTFVTNGPILSFEINGFGMGDNVSISSGERLTINAEASINPDIDQLARFELIEQGDVIREVISDAGSDELKLSHELTAEHGTWFVVRAYGKNQKAGDGSVAAVSAPIYVSVDGQRTWKLDDVTTLANKMKSALDSFASLSLESAGRLDEWFETRRPWTANWASQQDLLRERIDHAKTKYDRLIQLSAEQ